MAILGELPSTSGSCYVPGKVSYAPQEAWVFHGTARENILFGDTFRDHEYWSVVEACSLNLVCG
jgi:ABC-type multidrug transport system fused ATPase/permease subunit